MCRLKDRHKAGGDEQRGGEGRRRESRGVTDSLTVSPCSGNERECGGRQLQAVTRRMLPVSVRMSGLKNIYFLRVYFIPKAPQVCFCFLHGSMPYRVSYLRTRVCVCVCMHGRDVDTPPPA